MPKLIDLTGKRFGRLVVTSITKKRVCTHVVWLCQCDCGKITSVVSGDLLSGGTKSCGCLRKEQRANSKPSFKHGDASRRKPARLYNIWAKMKDRCLNPNCKDYKYYGGKGIVVCESWKNSYLAFKWWAMSHGYEESLSIDRIKHRGNYEPSNCQWLTNSENVKKAYKDRR